VLFYCLLQPEKEHLFFGFSDINFYITAETGIKILKLLDFVWYPTKSFLILKFSV